MPPKGGGNAREPKARSTKKTDVVTVPAARGGGRSKGDEEEEEEEEFDKKKAQRKEEKDAKLLEAAKRKAENKALVKEEEDRLVAKKPTAKVTQAQLEAAKRRDAEAARIQREKAQELQPGAVVKPKPLEPNINREIAAALAEGEVEARSVTDAIALVSPSAARGADAHPERRQKAAYLSFEEANLPRLRQENPSLKLSQLKLQLQKAFEKSPENPFNQ